MGYQVIFRVVTNDLNRSKIDPYSSYRHVTNDPVVIM